MNENRGKAMEEKYKAISKLNSKFYGGIEIYTSN